MRFRTLMSLPSFTGYVTGFSVARTLAYGLADHLGRHVSREKRARKEVTDHLFKLSVRQAMKDLGIGTQPARPCLPAAVMKVPTMEALPCLPAPESRLTEAPRQVLRPHHPVANPWQTRPAAVSRTGGLRGSAATRHR